MTTTLTDEAQQVLAEIEAMSQDNATGSTTYTVRVINPEWETEFSVARPWARTLEPRARALATEQLTLNTLGAIGDFFQQKDAAEALRRTRLASSQVYDGDRPEGLTYEDIRKAARFESEYRLRWQDPGSRPFSRREQVLDRGRGDGSAAGVYETHREIHEALAGEDTSGCKWCRAADVQKGRAGSPLCEDV